VTRSDKTRLPRAVARRSPASARVPASPTRAERRAAKARGLRRGLPRTLRPTRAGWVFFAFTFGVGLAALNTGNNLLYMIHTLLLSFLVLSGVFSESALRGIRVRRILPAELVAERPGQVALEITNGQTRILSFAIVVEDCVRIAGDERVVTGRAFALRVGPGEREQRSYTFLPATRGLLEFTGVRVATRFPFGLFSKAMWLDLTGEIVVFPALDPVDVRGVRGGQPREAERAGARGGASAEASGLREYARGDSLRRVHWRASLRRDELLVREPEQEQQHEVTLRLATRGAKPGDAFEREVRRVASEVAVHLADGRRVSLRTDDTAFLAGSGARQRALLLGYLATAAPEAEPAP